jgi:hypothetical protein
MKKGEEKEKENENKNKKKGPGKQVKCIILATIKVE